MHPHTLSPIYAIVWEKLTQRYGRAVNTHDLLKVIAVALMIVDHLGVYIFDNNHPMRMLGRGAAPIFYFLIGYSGKLNCRPRLFVYAAILSLSPVLFFNKVFWINILFTFIAAHLLMQLFSPSKTPPWLLYTIALLLFLANFFCYQIVEYGTLGILLTLSTAWMRQGVPYGKACFIGVLILHFIWQSVYFELFSSQLLLFGIVSIGVISGIVFYTYRLRQIPCPKPLALPVLLISRYSLDIYFFHYIALQLYFAFYRLSFTLW